MKKFFQGPAKSVQVLLIVLFVISFLNVLGSVCSYILVDNFLSRDYIRTPETLSPFIQQSDLWKLDVAQVFTRYTIIVGLINLFAVLVLFLGVYQKSKSAFYGTILYFSIVIAIALLYIFSDHLSFSNVFMVALCSYGIFKLYSVRKTFL